jgi:uncharacterized damage-inducible protein DinB
MLPAAQALITELDAETPVTRRVLARLPATQFDWRPHPKSLSAGQLAHHIATIPGNMARLAQLEGLDMATRQVEYAASDGPAALLAALDASVAAAREMLAGLDNVRAHAVWRMTNGDREVFAVPRLGMLRTMCFNHWYHHRGELVVYLRLLGVPVPVVYGRSADENPFSQAGTSSPA